MEVGVVQRVVSVRRLAWRGERARWQVLVVVR